MIYYTAGGRKEAKNTTKHENQQHNIKDTRQDQRTGRQYRAAKITNRKRTRTNYDTPPEAEEPEHRKKPEADEGTEATITEVTPTATIRSNETKHTETNNKKTEPTTKDEPERETKSKKKDQNYCECHDT